MSPKELLLSVIDPYDVYTELIGSELEVGGSNLIESPLREDSLPTFGLFIHHTDDVILFKDFAYETGDIFKFVKLYVSYHEDILLKTNKDVVKYLNTRLKLGLYGEIPGDIIYKDKPKRINIRTSRNIKFKSRPFTALDKMYWKEYNISIDILERYNVRSIKMLFDEDDNITRVFKTSELCFGYIIKDKIKLYQPLETNGYKWRNTCPAHYIQGWSQCTLKPKLIITKSFKDIMTFHSILGKDYDIIAPHTEGYNFTEKEVNILNKVYASITVIYDYDRAGINGANKLKKLHGWIPKFIDTKRVMINGKLKVINKDISDLTQNKGIKQATIRCKKMGL